MNRGHGGEAGASRHPETAEHRRLADSEARRADWKNWGPYVSDRAWGTVREDYSADGDAWSFFPHEHARSRAYRWNEDGIGGVCNRFQNVCMAVALWNGEDPILKERFFGLGGPEGNHGEDVKEHYFYLDSTPTHSYMRMLYKYPQGAFPYADLVHTNAGRNKEEPEYELVDTGAFAEDRYFDVFIEYAKAGEQDILCRVTAVNRGPEPAPLHILPHLWFRNTWSWRHAVRRPEMQAVDHGTARFNHRHVSDGWWHVEDNGHGPELLFTENETNAERLFGAPNATPYVKDGINDAVVQGQKDRVNPGKRGSKAAAHYAATVQPGKSFTVRTRFSAEVGRDPRPFDDFDDVFDLRKREADEFYAALPNPGLSEDEAMVQRQALAGLLWSKQFYHYSVQLWLNGDPATPPPPRGRRWHRNADWTHLYNLDVISMPDKWEYPWYATWDLAFHCVPLAMVDPEWAKRQLILMTREWYMHPNGQLPAYEWDFSDVNPPVHAWAALEVYRVTREATGKADTLFLERIFHKLLLNFTWWVNRKDADGRNVFQGGFLGLDNIGVFDRSQPLPGGGHLEQADGTAWMAMYSLNMLAIALELARTDMAYEDVATKFFEHFLWIAHAINHGGGEHEALWDEADGFFYDSLHATDGEQTPLKVRSMVGLIPLFAVEILDRESLSNLERFRQRMDWFTRYRPGMLTGIASFNEPGEEGSHLLSLVDRAKLERVLARMFDETELLSEYGVRSLSKFHESTPYRFHMDGQTHTVRYEPAESTSYMFGGNSNWRGPVWFPLNFLAVESLRKHHEYYGADLKVELPRGSGNWLTLGDAADELARRLIRIFLRDESRGGRRPVFGGQEFFQQDPQWRDYVPFYEYFHGDNGAGIGASHQTGWTALVARLIQQCGGTT
ncbi:MAG: MGH1-like glycoside hydrolase domain-containing protein [Chloroflexota bacterium]